jgi:hypothetical protein
LLADADSRPDGWLHAAAIAMSVFTERDHAAWCEKRRPS